MPRRSRHTDGVTLKSVETRVADLTRQIRLEREQDHERRVQFEKRMRRTGYPVAVALGLVGLAAGLGFIHKTHAPKTVAAMILESDVPVDTSPISYGQWLAPSMRQDPHAEQLVGVVQDKIRAKATGVARAVVRHYLDGYAGDTVQSSPDPRTVSTADIILTETASNKDCQIVRTQVELGVHDYKVTSVKEVTTGVVQKDPLAQPGHTLVMQRQLAANGDSSWSINMETGVDFPAESTANIIDRQNKAERLLETIDLINPQ